MGVPWNQYHLEIRDGFVTAGLSTADKHLSVRSDRAIPVDKWTHLAGAYDGETLRLYVDGTKQSQQAKGYGPIVDSKEALTIGVWGGSNYFFHGLIDEVRISSVDRFKTLVMNNNDTNRIVIEKAKKPPVIDGRVDTASGEWSQASNREGFYSSADKTRIRRPEPEVLLTFDDENLYIAIVAPFDQSLKADEKGHDGPVFRDDAIEIIIDPRKTGVITYQFAFNSLGAQYEGYLRDKAWNGNWLCKTSVVDNQWISEVAIPFSTFGLPNPYDGELWGINVCRDYADPREFASLAGAVSFLDPRSLLELEFVGGSREIKLLPSSFRFNWHVEGVEKKKLVTEIDVSGVSPAQRDKIIVDVSLKNADGKPLLTEQMQDLKDSRIKVGMNVTEIPRASYQLNVSLHDEHGNLVDTKTSEFIKPDESVWSGNTIGMDNEVPPPWTPLESEGETIRCWNRDYHFDGGAFPAQIDIGGTAILSSPIQLNVKAGGEEFAWQKAKPQVVQQKPDKIVNVIQNQSKSLVLHSTVTTEFDGMIRVDMQLEPKAADPVDVDELYLEMPLKPEYATLKYILTYPTGNFYNPNILGAVQENWHGQFSPQVWLGNEEMGLAWFAESDRGWDLDKEDRALEIIRDKQAVTLRVNLIDHRVTVKEPLLLTFGFLATPAKPLPDDWQEMRVSCYAETEPRVFIDWSFPWKEKWFAFPAVRDVIRSGSTYTSYDELIAHYKTLVPQYIPYINIDCASTALPEYRFYEEQWRSGGPVEGTTGTQTSDVAAFGASLVGVCTQSSWSDFFIYALNEFFDKYPMDGVYIDNSGAGTCSNPVHNTCFFEKYGNSRGTVNIFATRELQKRLYKIVKAKNKDNIVIAHSAGSVALPVASFYDAHVDGERFYNISDYIGTIPLDEFKAECAAEKWGVVSIVDPQIHKPELRPDSRSTENMIALTRLHGSLIWPGMGNCHTRSVVKMRRIERAFGMENTEFLPYWRNQDVVTTSSDAIKATMFAKKDKILVYVANLADTAADARITFTTEKLGLRPDRAVVRDLWNDNKPVAISNGVIEMSIKEKNFRLLEVSAP